MKLSNYIKYLQSIEEVFGGDLEVIYCEDDEGNYYSKVHYEPNVGTFIDGEFIQEESYKVDCVCIN